MTLQVVPAALSGFPFISVTDAENDWVLLPTVTVADGGVSVTVAGAPAFTVTLPESEMVAPDDTLTLLAYVPAVVVTSSDALVPLPLIVPTPPVDDHVSDGDGTLLPNVSVANAV
jgi:hypothetical protein